MKVTMKELFNAHYEALEVCLYAATIENEGKKEVRFYIWLNDTQNEFIMQQEFYTYEAMFSVLQFVPLDDDELEQLLKHINKYQRYWEQTQDGKWLTDDGMFQLKDEIENTDFDVDEEDDDYDYDDNQFSFPFLNGTLITANSGEDGITVNVMDDDDENVVGTFQSFEDMLYGIAPVIQENSQSKYELGFVARRLKVTFDSEMEPEEIIEILMK